MKKLFKTLLIGAGLATAIAPQVAQSGNAAVVERQAINDIKTTKKQTITNHFGGVPLVTEYYGNAPGLTPKEYGIRYGNGASRKYRTNKKHRSHMILKSHKKSV